MGQKSSKMASSAHAVSRISVIMPVPMVLPPSRSVKLNSGSVYTPQLRFRVDNLPGPDLSCDIIMKRADHLNVVTGHNHLFFSIGSPLRP